VKETTEAFQEAEDARRRAERLKKLESDEKEKKN